MAVPSAPLINGNRYSFASMEISFSDFGGLLSKRYVGFKGVDYTTSLEPGKVFGTGPRKIGRTKGKFDPSGSLELYASEFDDLVQAIVTAAKSAGFQNPGYGEYSFNVFINYADTGMPVVFDQLIGCRITKAQKSRSEGTDALSVKCDLDLMDVIENGVSIVGPQVNPGP